MIAVEQAAIFPGVGERWSSATLGGRLFPRSTVPDDSWNRSPGWMVLMRRWCSASLGTVQAFSCRPRARWPDFCWAGPIRLLSPALRSAPRCVPLQPATGLLFGLFSRPLARSGILASNLACKRYVEDQQDHPGCLARGNHGRGHQLISLPARAPLWHGTTEETRSCS